MIIGRVVQAIGVCASSVLSRAIARDLFSGNELGRVLSFIMVAMTSIRQTNARAKNPARPIETA
jgi:MFS transporter, DHA1 family, multidrug resistance protein